MSDIVRKPVGESLLEQRACVAVAFLFNPTQRKLVEVNRPHFNL